MMEKITKNNILTSDTINNIGRELAFFFLCYDVGNCIIISDNSSNKYRSSLELFNSGVCTDQNFSCTKQIKSWKVYTKYNSLALSHNQRQSQR